MKFDLFSPRNRRAGHRVTAQVEVRFLQDGTVCAGRTLNLSDRGARLVVRQDLPHRFDLTLDLARPVAVKAEKVWEETLGQVKIVGVRFSTNRELKNLLA